MPAFVLLKRNSSDQSLEAVLGIYTSWERGRAAFHERWKKGGWPYTGGIIHYSDKEAFYYALAQADPQKVSFRLYTNDFTVVDLVKINMDSPVG